MRIQTLSLVTIAGKSEGSTNNDLIWQGHFVGPPNKEMLLEAIGSKSKFATDIVQLWTEEFTSDGENEFAIWFSGEVKLGTIGLTKSFTNLYTSSKVPEITDEPDLGWVTKVPEDIEIEGIALTDEGMSIVAEWSPKRLLPSEPGCGATILEAVGSLVIRNQLVALDPSLIGSRFSVHEPKFDPQTLLTYHTHGCIVTREARKDSGNWDASWAIDEWTTEQGRKIRLRDMGTMHLYTALKLTIQKAVAAKTEDTVSIAGFDDIAGMDWEYYTHDIFTSMKLEYAHRYGSETALYEYGDNLETQSDQQV